MWPLKRLSEGEKSEGGDDIYSHQECQDSYLSTDWKRNMTLAKYLQKPVPTMSGFFQSSPAAQRPLQNISEINTE